MGCTELRLGVGNTICTIEGFHCGTDDCRVHSHAFALYFITDQHPDRPFSRFAKMYSFIGKHFLNG